MTPEDVLGWLRAHGSEEHRASLVRYNISNKNTFGVPMGDLKAQSKKWGRNHELALELWPTGWYEARIVAAHIADPMLVDGTLMDAWTADCGNWAICDTCCFALFGQAPLRWEKAAFYSTQQEEFVKRTGFALIWTMTQSDKTASNAAFLDTFPLFRSGATDPRPLVSKAVDMALRSIGKRNLRCTAPPAPCLRNSLRRATKMPNAWGANASKS